MGLTLEEKKRVVVLDALKDMGMTQSAAGEFDRKFRRSGYDTAMLSEMIRDSIYNDIDIYRKQTYETFGIGYSVSPSGRKDPVSEALQLEAIELTLPLLGKIVVGYRQYDFAPYHNEKPAKTMHVRIHRGGIRVYFRGSWQPVSAYLEEEVGTEVSEPFNAEAALNRQCEWWEANGKSFDIQNLPVELAEIVCDHALPAVAQPHPLHKCRRLRKLVVAPKHPLALMHVNKRTHDITKRVLYDTKAFFIKHYPIMKKTLNNKFLAHNLRNLTLGFNHSGYLHLFHFDPENITLPHAYAYANPHFRNLNLNSLEIHIGTPSETSIIEGACQVSVVDLIFDVAWPSIKGHPLKISGWVKDSQKKRIESLANDEHIAYKKWASLTLAATNEVGTLSQYDVFMARMMEEEQGGVRLDGKAWDEVEENSETGLSALMTHSLGHYLECRCETKCSAEDWTCKG